MKRHMLLRGFALACGIALAVAPFGRPVTAAEPGPATMPSGRAETSAPATTLQSPTSRDITLGAGGRMDGVLLDRQGMPLAGMPVMLMQNDHEVASVKSDENGRFAITGLRGGQYNLATLDAVTPCRLWSEGTAPPSAKPSLQVYGGDLARGQMFRARNILTSPTVIGAGIGTAIAVPLALHNREPAS
ncbi:MAG: carboxypeptidase-like regulatory domain-containing protein [Planctomycetes bacterium]|nr:carboxypeptidase-like regulatory domain-containing protein [Planctomycetota bacterium]